MLRLRRRSDTVWTAAPKIDADGRPVELLGGLKAAFKSETVKSPAPTCSGGTDGRTLKDRTDVLEKDIGEAGMVRPKAGMVRLE